MIGNISKSIRIATSSSQRHPTGEKAFVYLLTQLKHLRDFTQGNPLIWDFTDLTDRRYVFCLYTVHTGDMHDRQVTLEDFREYLKIDAQNKKFGDSLLYFKEPDEFMKRLRMAIDKIRVNFKAGPVDYYDVDLLHGRLPSDRVGFVKPSRFSHQKEYRLCLDQSSPVGDSFTLEVGDLSDITEITTIEEFNKLISVASEEDETD